MPKLCSFGCPPQGKKALPGYITREMKPFQKTIKNLRSEISRLRKKGKTYRGRLENAVKMSKDIAFHRLVNTMKAPARLFVHMQLQAMKKPKGRRFTVDEKVMALSLFKRSPKCYTLLYKYFTLPSVKAMKRLLGKIKIYPGINPVIFEKIKQNMTEKDKPDRLCSLMFDEMSITAHVSYNACKDNLEGFANNKDNNFADHALVFMVKGITKKFKQPVAYYFTNSLNKIELKNLIKTVVKHVQESGIIVVNTVCDQSAVNVGAIKELINDSKAECLRKEVEWTYDFFNVCGQKIIPIFDVPHLIKGIRNNLMTKDMLYTTNNNEKLVKFSYYQQVYAADKSYGELRLLNKITEEHVDPLKVNKMRVKSATQLFSHSVAVVTEHLTARGDLPDECRSLIDITLLLDDLFDSLNGNTYHIPNGKKFKGPVRKNCPHHELWKRAKKVIKSIKFLQPTKNGNKIRITETIIPSVTNLVKTIEGMETIWQVVSKKYGVDALLTRNLNQDPVENFFGSIRSYGARNVAPTSVGFEGAYKALLLNNLNTTHSNRANCEEDENSECLQNLNFFLTETVKDVENFEDIPLNNEVLVEKTEKDAGQRNYVCGWVLTKLLKSVIKKCKTCRDTVLEKNENKNNDFIKVKEYKKKWLVYPSEPLEICFHEVQNIVTGFLKGNVPKKNLRQYIDGGKAKHLKRHFFRK